ncbi:MAG: TIGR00725 family protein [Bacillota bacterium]|jgi:uncharacterized protein (TIGR00725 family)|nr:TIGR00725 family protein [Bacillota bacterium]
MRNPVRRRIYIGVIGSAEADPEVLELAREVGQEIARRGAVLVCGGRGGVMEAAARGAREAGGTAVGILPGTSRSEGNPYLTVSVVTGMGEARNAIVVRSSDAVIAVAGGCGTLSEIGLALKMGVPVVGLRTWQLGSPCTGQDPIIRAASPAEAVALAFRSLGFRPAPAP